MEPTWLRFETGESTMNLFNPSWDGAEISQAALEQFHLKRQEIERRRSDIRPKAVSAFVRRLLRLKRRRK
jgi:hypothetical protein